MGSVRNCIDNTCHYSDCVVPGDDDIDTREGVESFEDAVKPFEVGINLSQRTTNPTLVKNSMISSLGIQDVLMLLIKGIGIFFIALVASLIFAFAKAKGLIKYIIIVLVPLLIVIGAIVVMGGTTGLWELLSGEKSWNTITHDDLSGAYFGKNEFSAHT